MRDAEILINKSRSVNNILMTSTGPPKTADRPPGRIKNVELQKGTPALYLTLDEMVKSRKEKDDVKRAEKIRKEEVKAEKERKCALRCVIEDCVRRKLDENEKQTESRVLTTFRAANSPSLARYGSAMSSVLSNQAFRKEGRVEEDVAHSLLSLSRQ